MDVVADTGPVDCLVVVPVHRERRQRADRDPGDVGRQVVRDAQRVLTDPAARVGADRVKVAEHRDTPVGVRGPEVGQDRLDHRLVPAVGVGRAVRT